jgi:uncharacterized glyoxalase superfamily protein PhnB
MDKPVRRPTLSSALIYEDPRAALDWLERAFGFAREVVISDPQGQLVHAEMRYAEGSIMIGAKWAEFTASPLNIGGRNTQSLHVHLAEDLAAHCERARAAGAAILQEPADQFWGDRTYRARDPEGHVWTFAQSIRVVSREEAERDSGLVIEGWS